MSSWWLFIKLQQIVHAIPTRATCHYFFLFSVLPLTTTYERSSFPPVSTTTSALRIPREGLVVEREGLIEIYKYRDRMLFEIKHWGISHVPFRGMLAFLLSSRSYIFPDRYNNQIEMTIMLSAHGSSCCHFTLFWISNWPTYLSSNGAKTYIYIYICYHLTKCIYSGSLSENGRALIQTRRWCISIDLTYIKCPMWVDVVRSRLFDVCLSR